MCSSDPPQKGDKGRKRAKKAGKDRLPGRAARHSLTPPRTRMKWVPLVLFAFFPCFIVFFASKLAIFPLKVVSWELEKAIFGPEKDKW